MSAFSRAGAFNAAGIHKDIAVGCLNNLLISIGSLRTPSIDISLLRGDIVFAISILQSGMNVPGLQNWAATKMVSRQGLSFYNCLAQYYGWPLGSTTVKV